MVLWYSEIPFRPCQNSYHQENKRQQVLERVWEKRYMHSWWKYKLVCHGGCHVSVEASQKAKYKTSLWPSYTQGIYPRESIFFYKGICSFKVLLFYLQQACSKIFFTIFHKVTKWQNSPIIWWEYLETKKKSNESGTTETDPRLLIRRLTQTYQISFNLCLSGLWFYKIIAIAVIPAEKMALLMVITNSFTCASGKSHTQVSTIITLLLHKRKWRQRESG